MCHSATEDGGFLEPVILFFVGGGGVVVQGGSNLWEKIKTVYYYTSKISVVKANISHEGCSVVLCAGDTWVTG